MWFELGVEDSYVVWVWGRRQLCGLAVEEDSYVVWLWGRRQLCGLGVG